MAWERGAGKGREGAEGVDVDLYEAGWPCQVAMCPSPSRFSRCFGSACSRSMGRGLGSREVRSALYSRSSKARGTRRRMRGFERVVDINAFRALAPLPRAPFPGHHAPSPAHRSPAGAAGTAAPRVARKASFPTLGSRKRRAVALDVLFDRTRRVAG